MNQETQEDQVTEEQVPEQVPEQKVPEQKTKRHSKNYCIFAKKIGYDMRRETLRSNLESIEAITKLRDENKKIEHTIGQQIVRLDRERCELKEEQIKQDENYKECMEQLNMRDASIRNAIRCSSEDTMVGLNIGGAIFYTLKSTVSNISPFFSCLFSDKWGDEKRKTIRDYDGNIFIDRSSQYFGYILDWSRNGGGTQELINIVQSIFINTRYEQSGLSAEINIKTFIKTLEYYGIDHEIINLDLIVGNSIDIYWRGDHRTYRGTVKKLYFDEEEQCLFVTIKYIKDYTMWEYQVNKIDKTKGPYRSETKQLNRVNGKKTKWWHYGADKGAKKIRESSSVCERT